MPGSGAVSGALTDNDKRKKKEEEKKEGKKEGEKGERKKKRKRVCIYKRAQRARARAPLRVRPPKGADSAAGTEVWRAAGKKFCDMSQTNL